MSTLNPNLFDRIERFYDAVPRDEARAEEHGGLVLFVREGRGWPFYARPRLGAAEPPSAADVMAVRARQRDLGLPEAFEWVHDVTPDLLAVARSAGLAVLQAPLMVLGADGPPPPVALTRVPVRVIDAADPAFAVDLAARRAVADVAFATPASGAAGAIDATGAAGAVEPPGPADPAGPAERDAALPVLSAAEVDAERRRVATGRMVAAVAETPELGAVASGGVQRVGDVAEIVGVATLPVARGRGLGAAITAALARRVLADGADLVLLSAGSEDTARVYVRAGFRRIGTACIAEPAAG